MVLGFLMVMLIHAGMGLVHDGCVVAVHAGEDNVVVGVAIVLDEGAALILDAGELNGVWVNRANRGQVGLTFVDDHSRVSVVGGGCDFSVNIGAHMVVSTNHGEFDTVSADRSVDSL